MAERVDSTALRWLIGGELARQREQVGMSLTDVASATGLPKTKINHMETARTAQRPDEVREVLAACQSTADTTERLISAASQPTGRPWWNRWRSVVPEWFGLYLGLEGMATTIFVYEIAAIHGLIQTHDYAADVTGQSNIISPDSVDRRVSLRMARAERLQEPPPLTSHAVLDEAVFHRKLTDPTVLACQYDYLLEITERDNVTLQVIPSARELRGVISMGNYALLTFNDLQPVAYSEIYHDAFYIREPDKIQSFQAASTHLSDIALSPDETRKYISDLRRSGP